MLIDIRDEEKYQKGHLKGAIHIPFSRLSLRPESYLKKEENYTLYCDSGVKSKMLVTYLNSLGYHCVNLDGGYSKNLFG